MKWDNFLTAWTFVVQTKIPLNPHFPKGDFPPFEKGGRGDFRAPQQGESVFMKIYPEQNLDPIGKDSTAKLNTCG